MTGVLNTYRLGTIQKAIEDAEYIPLKEFMLYTQYQYMSNSTLAYAQGWSLMYFFIHAQNGRYRPYLRKYFKALVAGKKNKAALDEAFGRINWKKLTTEWSRYVTRLKEK